MYLAMFGPKGFTVSSEKVVTFDEFGLESGLDTETQESKDKKPSTYIKGAGLDSFSIKVRLEAELGIKPLEQIESWMQVKDEAKAYPFLIKGKPLMNTKWILKNVSVNETNFDAAGNLFSATLTLKFEEFVKAGSKKEESTKRSKKTKAVKSSKSTKQKDTTSVYNVLSPSQKADLNRIK
ncbi:phage tail protein [Niameybacter massiliensis]|uniref:phage tail protein n=1 Tax=Niameybacter massiliensis TaxID=1658108 RepID=UPI0006B6648C|nr:phage tail protein [Niameybacter massiliensis]